MRDDEKYAVVVQRISAIEDAFPRDDLGKPDYYAHRKSHLDEQKSDERMEEIKDNAIKQIATWALGLILLAIGAYWGIK